MTVSLNYIYVTNIVNFFLFKFLGSYKIDQKDLDAIENQFIISPQNFLTNPFFCLNIYAKMAELRWNHKHTYEEIIDKMNK